MVAIILEKSCLSVEQFGKKVQKEQKVSFRPYSDMTSSGITVTLDFIDGLINNRFLLINNTTHIRLSFIKAYNNKVLIKLKIIENLKELQCNLKEVKNSVMKEYTCLIKNSHI